MSKSVTVGWAVLGHAIETVAGDEFEALVAQRIFAPLGMTGAGSAVGRLTTIRPNRADITRAKRRYALELLCGLHAVQVASERGRCTRHEGRLPWRHGERRGWNGSPATLEL